MNLAELPDLYPRLLGSAWFDLDPVVRQAHVADQTITATLEIRDGEGLLARGVRSALRLPTSADGRNVTLRITPDAGTERWVRVFGRRSIVTIQRALSDGCLGERFGALELRFRLRAAGGALSYAQVGAALSVGPWTIPLPRGIAPRVEAREQREAGGDRAHVHVRVWAPMIGFLMSYEGFLEIGRTR